MFILSLIFFNAPIAIYDFKKVKDTTDWFVVNDGVMGGLSQGSLSKNEAGHGLFKGFVTTENNGGFSSIRYQFDEKDVSEFSFIVLKVKGDGKTYQFRIKENASQRYSYIRDFKTTGSWETIKIPLTSFYPSFRGYALDKSNYSGMIMEEIALLIGNKKKESFALEIKSIGLE
ncbi:MAG: CIA30 family protein [Bacteroidia bacterium]|nr:CIA30 family protein [Bacteroidia bacterium]NNL33660.1 CIA30 family protein [Flavobacteriaceae bacterium]